MEAAKPVDWLPTEHYTTYFLRRRILESAYEFLRVTLSVPGEGRAPPAWPVSPPLYLPFLARLLRDDPRRFFNSKPPSNHLRTFPLVNAEDADFMDGDLHVENPISYQTSLPKGVNTDCLKIGKED